MLLIESIKLAKKYWEPASRPTQKQFRAWVEGGHMPGMVIAGVTYVDLDAFLSLSDAPTPPAQAKKPEINLQLIENSNNPLLDRLRNT